MCASVTSNNFKDDTDTPPHTTSDVIAALVASNPHYRYANLDDHGFCVLDVTPERIQCDWWVIGDRGQRRSGIRHHASYAVSSGSAQLSPVRDLVT